MPERGPIKIGGFTLPESIYWSAIERKMEAERREKEGEREYHQGIRSAAKDSQITFRIAKSDIAKLKRIAHARNRRYQAYLRDILRREIERERVLEAQREATAAPRTPGRKPR